MRGKALTTDDIKQQIARGRNYERLYLELKPKYDAALQRIAELEAQVAAQEAQFAAQLQAQAARIEQLETMVFGRKSKLPKQARLRLTTKRDSTTYRRPIPPASAITAEDSFTIDHCHRCGHLLTDKRAVIRFEEDIVLAAFDPRLDNKTVTKQCIEQGWCSRCGQYASAKDLRGQDVSLGPVVRTYIVYLMCHLDLSYAQVQDLLWQQHQLYVAGSEVATILAERRIAYLPLYEQLQESVRDGPSHLDETRYPIQAEQGAGYAHVMAGADGTPAEHDVVFVLADSRGKGNSETLVGARYRGVGVTDRYGSYKHLFVKGQHQICWAHLARNAKDIARLQCLDEPTAQHATQFYQKLSRIYATTRHIWAEPFDRTPRHTQAAQLLSEVVALCQPDEQDPKQLHDLKTGILEYQDCLFVCLTEPHVPPDNNKAERALRKLVLRRKKSFGVKTTKGARTMEVLYSVVQSLANRNKATLLQSLHQATIA